MRGTYGMLLAGNCDAGLFANRGDFEVKWRSFFSIDRRRVWGT